MVEHVSVCLLACLCRSVGRCRCGSVQQQWLCCVQWSSTQLGSVRQSSALLRSMQRNATQLRSVQSKSIVRFSSVGHCQCCSWCSSRDRGCRRPPCSSSRLDGNNNQRRNQNGKKTGTDTGNNNNNYDGELYRRIAPTHRNSNHSCVARCDILSVKFPLLLF